MRIKLQEVIMLRVGLDVGSTTIKCVVLNEDNNIIYKDYKRHYSHIKDNNLKIKRSKESMPEWI